MTLHNAAGGLRRRRPSHESSSSLPLARSPGNLASRTDVDQRSLLTRISAKWCCVVVALLLAVPLISARAVGEGGATQAAGRKDRKSTRLNSSHQIIS